MARPATTASLHRRARALFHQLQRAEVADRARDRLAFALLSVELRALESRAPRLAHALTPLAVLRREGPRA